MSSDAVAVHFKRRHRKPLVASKRKGKVLRLLQAGRVGRRWNGERSASRSKSRKSLTRANSYAAMRHSRSRALRFGIVVARIGKAKNVSGDGSRRPFALVFGQPLQKRFKRLLRFGITVEFLHDAAVHLLHPLVFLNLVQDEFADGAFMRQFIKEFELVGIGFNPRINLFIGARIFTVLNRPFEPRLRAFFGFVFSIRFGCCWFSNHQSFVPFTEGVAGAVNGASVCAFRNSSSRASRRFSVVVTSLLSWTFSWATCAVAERVLESWLRA